MFNAVGRVAAIALLVVAGVAACGGEDPAKPSYTISVTVSGLVAGRTVVLRNNGGSDLPLSANGTANFGMALASGSAYAVTVFTQPAGQMCTVANGTGTVGSANVTNVTVTCTRLTYTVGGTVNGLGAGKTLVLRNNGGNDLTIAANGAFTFTTAVNSGAAYVVTVATQPPGEMCSIASGTGTIVSANVTNVTITCSTLSYTVSGTITGLLANRSLVLRNNAGNDIQIFANVGFTFSIPVASGATYTVTVSTQPAGQTCTVANGTGTIVAANVTNVTVTCSAQTFTVGGTVAGLGAGKSLIVRNNGGNDLAVAADGGFTFSTAVASGANYAITVLTQPVGQTCTVANGTGTIVAANVVNVTITCVTLSFSVGGMVGGLAAGQTVVLRNNGGNDLTVAANGAFSFSTLVASGAGYAVTVFTQPVGQTCAVANGTGTIAAANVSNVAISCL